MLLLNMETSEETLSEFLGKVLTNPEGQAMLGDEVIGTLRRWKNEIESGSAEDVKSSELHHEEPVSESSELEL
jgi:hypothetical protein